MPLIHSRFAKHTQASQCIDTVDVHGTTTADTLSATSPEGQGGVDLVLDSDERIQHHGTGLVQIQAVGLHLGLLGGLVRVPAVDVELLDSRSLGQVGVLNVRSPGLGGDLLLGRASATDSSSRINSGCIRASKDGRTEQRPRGCDEARGRTKSSHCGRTRGRFVFNHASAEFKGERAERSIEECKVAVRQRGDIEMVRYSTSLPAATTR